MTWLDAAPLDPFEEYGSVFMLGVVCIILLIVAIIVYRFYNK